MATGLIGTSSVVIDAYNTSQVSGPILTYTCPESGVRYAVVSIFASVSISITCTTTGGYAEAGSLRVAYSDNGTTSGSNHYSVILSPGQIWSGSTYFSAATTETTRSGSAVLQASVLEVV